MLWLKNNIFCFFFYILFHVCLILYQQGNIFLENSSINFDYANKQYNNKITFVSCFFPLKSGIIRHSIKYYKKKMSRLFNLFSENIKLFIFTSNEGKEILQNSRLNEKNQSIPLSSNIKFITKYQTVFDIPRISKYQNQYEIVAKIMQKAVPYNISAEIGAIWNSKLVFIQEVIENYSKSSIFFFWIDIAIVKTDEYFHMQIPLEWPSSERIEKIFSFEVDQKNTSSEKVYTNKILFWGELKSIKKPESINNIDISKYECFVRAGFFGGTRKKMISFMSEYWKIHDFFLEKKQFVLREEFILGAFLALNKNDVFMIDKFSSKCLYLQSCVGFIAKYNLCKFNNFVHVFKTNRGKYIPIKKDLGDWI